MVSTFTIKQMCAGLVGLLFAAQLHATIFQVTVDTTGLAGTAATLAFDLASGDADTGPSSVTISDFSGAGTTLSDAFFVYDFDVPMAASTLLGDVTLVETGLILSEYQQHLTLGTAFTFRFSTIGNAPPDSAGTPDAFSFSLLDADAVQALVTTGDGGDPQTILFRYDIGGAGIPEPLPIVDPSEGVTVSIVEAAAVPEPGVTLLLLGALMALIATRSAGFRRRSPQRSCPAAR